MRQLLAAFLVFLIVVPSVSDSSKVNHTIYKEVQPTFTQREVNCLAKNVYFEARGEPFIGQKAVAQVTLNRWDHDPRMNLCDVVYQHNEYGCQFSWTCDHRSDSPNTNSQAWKTALMAVYYVLKFGTCGCGVGNAFYYHKWTVRPYWTKHLKFLKRIGNHIFYAVK